MTDEQLLEAFHAHTIPLSEWDHRKHLRLAWIHLSAYPFDDAVDRIRTGIRAYNAAVGVPEGLTMGFHETMTIAWMKLIDFTMREHGAETSSDAFFDAQPQLCVKQLLRLFYSKDQFVSERAKREFVSPDRTDFPTPSGNPDSPVAEG